MCIYITDFNAQNKRLAAKLLQHVFGIMNFYSVAKFYRRHFELESKHIVEFKPLLHQGSRNLHYMVIIIIIISLFKEDNVFSITASLHTVLR